MKNCTPLWRAAHFQVKMYKAPHARTTFASWDVQKVHAVAARSKFQSQNVQNTSASEHFWELRCRKNARRCGAKHMSKSKCTRKTTRSDHFWKLRCRKSARGCGAKHISKSTCAKHTMLGPPLEVEMFKKCTPLWREDHFEGKSVKTDGLGVLLEIQMSFRVAGANCGPYQKWATREDFVAFPKTMAGVGHLKRICKDAFSVAGAIQETSSSELLGGPGANFLRGVAFWSLRSSGWLRWFCMTGALRMTWPHFCGRGSTLDRRSGKIANALARGQQRSTQHSIFEGGLAGLLRFWCCQPSKFEEVSQNFFVKN